MKSVGTVIVLAILTTWFKFQFHELWKDEWQAWLVARDMSWTEMIGFLYYEGHGSLWYIWLKLWTFLHGLIPDASLIMLSHSVIYWAFLTVVFFLVRAPYSAKLLFCLGYFPIFEYGMLSRGYILILLLLALAVWIIQTDLKKYPLYVTLFLLCQTEIYGVFLAGMITVYLILHHWRTPARKGLFAMIGSVVLGAVVFLITVFPRQAVAEKQSDVYLFDQLSGSRLLEVMTEMLAQVFVTPVNLLGSPVLSIFAAFLAVGLIWISFKKHIIELLSFGSLLLVIWGFSFVVYEGGLRQWGSLFLGWAALAALADPEEKVARSAIILLLSLQLIYAALAIYRDCGEPFTHALETAEFIEKNVPPETIVVGINPMEMTPVIGYMDRPIYILPKGETMTYFQWLEKIYLPPQAELELFAQYKRVPGLLVLSDRPLDTKVYPDLELWRAFAQMSMKSEDYYLYSLSSDY